MQKFKPGDRVFSLKEGWLTLTNNTDNALYSLKDTRGRTYTEDGKHHYDDAYPSLFTYNPFETKPEFPKLMEVSDDGKTWIKRWVIADLTKLTSNDYPVIAAKGDPDEPFKIGLISYFKKYCREIQEEEITILTMDEVAKLIGKPVDKIQIKK